MNLTREPMDDLDLKILREAAALREHVEASADTDLAWADFEATLPGAVAFARPSRDDRRRWIVLATVGMVAALLVALVLVRVADERSPTLRPAGPTPTLPAPDKSAPAITPESYEGTIARLNGDLVVVGVDGDERVIGRIPASVLQSEQLVGGWPSGVAGYLRADLSSAGWVAVTGFVSEGFWFFDLSDPSLAPRWVDLAGAPGGHTSFGTWNPDGTLYAAVETSTTAVIIDPATGELSRLPSVDPPIGYSPTWTADGSGILTGESVRCDGGTPTAQRPLAIVPIDGGPESVSIPDLANGLEGVSSGGVWATDNRCTADPSGTPDPFADTSDVVVAGSPAGVETWVDAAKITPEVVRHSVFAASPPTLWVLTTEEGSPARMLLHEVTSPQSDRVVNTVTFDSASQQSVVIVGVAPDDSAVVVVVNGPEAERKFYLVPTDGSPAIELDGEFAGFVPRSMLDRLSASAPATSPEGTDTQTSTTVLSTAALTAPADLPTASGLRLPLFPDGRQITSISATSDAEFWILSDWAPGGRALLWHTVDGGATWNDVKFEEMPAIPANSQPGCLSCFGPNEQGGPKYPGSVYFADSMNGYLLFPSAGASGGIFSTNDGGRTWSLSQGTVMLGPSGISWRTLQREEDNSVGIASDGATVYVIGGAARDGSDGATTVMSSPIGSARFTQSSTLMGRYWITPNSNQLVAAGDTGWAVTFGTPDGGARLVDGKWVQWSPPCAVTPIAPSSGFAPVPRVRLAASTDGSDLVVLCAPATPSAGSAPIGVSVSRDGGLTFDERDQRLRGVLTGQSWVHLTDGGTIIVGTPLETGEFVMQRSTDDGRSWQRVATLGTNVSRAEVHALPSGRILAFAVAADETGSPVHVAEVSDDEGMTWQFVPFA